MIKELHSALKYEFHKQIVVYFRDKGKIYESSTTLIALH